MQPGNSSLDRVLSALAGADADGLFDSRDEDLSVADAAGLRGLLDDLEQRDDQIVGDDDLDLHLRDEVDYVRAASVDLALAARAAEAFDLGDRHALHADLRE